MNMATRTAWSPTAKRTTHGPADRGRARNGHAVVREFVTQRASHSQSAAPAVCPDGAVALGRRAIRRPPVDSRARGGRARDPWGAHRVPDRLGAKVGVRSRGQPGAGSTYCARVCAAGPWKGSITERCSANDVQPPLRRRLPCPCGAPHGRRKDRRPSLR